MKKFSKLQINYEILSSYLLFGGVVLAFIISNNNFLLSYYREFINLNFSISLGDHSLSKPLIKWVNDGLMAVFFFLLGLEMKYQIIEGEFVDKRNLILPTSSAIGGFLIPALLYVIVNYNNSETINGWAIPVATDTAFVLAIVSFVGNKVSNSAKVFLIGLAIIDDVAAVLALAIFYTPNLDIIQIYLCMISLVFLFILNYINSPYRFLYYLSAIILWIFTVKSGVHGTIAGIIAAFFIPSKVKLEERNIALVKEIEKALHTLVSLFILPFFAFVNCELPLNELSINDVLSPISIGCILGLFIGKPLGIYLFAMLAVKLKISKLPANTSKMLFLGLSCLCGIGFTLSLFIGLQAFDTVLLQNQMKIGVITASILSAFVGWRLCKYSVSK